MRKTNQTWRSAGVFFLLFIVFTLLLRFVDVQAIGPQGSSVGFASINGFVHKLTGVHMNWYEITDKLGYLALATAPVFAFVGILQLVQRKSLLKVDKSILVLGAFYVVVLVAYALFELLIVNYRPVLIDGILEASYPSSHTMMSVCFMSAAITECKLLLKNQTVCRILQILCTVLMVVIVVGRLISGVHWFTDIVGGLMISSALVLAYLSVLRSLRVKH